MSGQTSVQIWINYIATILLVTLCQYFIFVPLAFAEQTTSTTNVSGTRTAIIVLILVVLAVLFITVTIWSARLERTPYLATLYQDFTRDMEYERLFRTFGEKEDKQKYIREVRADSNWLNSHPEPDTPPGYENREWLREAFDRAETALARNLEFWLEDFGKFDGPSRLAPFRRNLRPGTTLPSRTFGHSRRPGEEPDQAEIDEAVAREDYFSRVWDWYQELHDEAYSRFRNIVGERAMKEAINRAKQVVKIDYAALRGRGKEFVLEFTAIVVIIFSAVILGIIGLLQDEHLATLLAAIAGYVLGRSTSRAHAKEDEPGNPQG